MRQRVAEGHQIILHTIRSGYYLTVARLWLEEHGVELYGINENPEQFHWSNSSKPYCNVYIDDRALGCPLVTPSGRDPYVEWKRDHLPLETRPSFAANRSSTRRRRQWRSPWIWDC